MSAEGMARRRFLAMLGGAATLPALRGWGRTAVPATRPNIVFLFSDDHALRAISAYGAALAPTPNIDRIAREGMLFRRSYCANSICGPSRATVLTGLHSHANGFMDNRSRFDGTQQTFPRLLQAAGYQTALRGKWHLGSDPTGFDSWMVYPGQGQYINPVYVTPGGREQGTGYSTDVTTDLALAWLAKDRDPVRPFFLAVQFKAPHRPFLPPARHLAAFDDTTFPEPPTLFDDYAHRSSALPGNRMRIDRDLSTKDDLKILGPGASARWMGWFGPEEAERLGAYRAHYARRAADFAERNPQGADLVRWKYQAYLRDYLGTVKAVDDSVGRILDALDRLDLAKNTLVVYASDQGFYLGEHGWFDKRWIYEESFSMPLLMRWPGAIPAGASCDALVQNIDYAPTFCELAGATPAKAMHGCSLVPFFSGKTPSEWRRALYYAYYEYPAPHRVAPHEGVATERHKLVRFPLTDEWELHDRQADPLEVTNVYASEDYADVRRDLTAELARLRKAYGVPPDYPRPNPKAGGTGVGGPAR